MSEQRSISGPLKNLWVYAKHNPRQGLVTAVTGTILIVACSVFQRHISSWAEDVGKEYAGKIYAYIGPRMLEVVATHPLLSIFVFLCAVIVAVLTHAYWVTAIKPYAHKQGDAHSEPKKEETAAPEEQQPTMESLMESGFPAALMKLSGKPVITFPDNTSFEIRSKLYLDFHSGSKFIGLYIPSSPRTCEICLVLASKVRELGDALQNDLRIISKFPGENPQDVKNFAYTGRVYLYHDDFLTHRQIADIEDQFRANHLEVILRGPDSLTAAFIAYKRRQIGEKQK